MLSSGLPPVLLVLSVLELSWSLSDEEKKIILDEHNKYRSQVSPPAKAMMKMSWDMDLEVGAQNHAKNCIWGQNGGLGRANLFATASTLDVKSAIEEWNKESKFYNLTTSTCVPGQMCDNYTQVVWAETTRVGCEHSFCKKVDGIEIENLQLLVCKYYPPGNRKDKLPYMEGPSCEKCPTGTVCEDNLCVPAKLETRLDQISVDPPKGGAPRTCLGLSLFLLPSAILVGLLL
ncbi:peptidase inhibitor 16-like [Sylvia atricapilla]|uniref:peptidase inhibitor 16-like n=1 Tax=Sylvia atricapilla TaxID=48155 RepID=UPI0033932676